jgi:hypothetical protein
MEEGRLGVSLPRQESDRFVQSRTKGNLSHQICLALTIQAIPPEGICSICQQAFDFLSRLCESDLGSDRLRNILNFESAQPQEIQLLSAKIDEIWTVPATIEIVF